MIASARTWLAAFLFHRGGLLALAVLTIYLALAPTYIVDGDNAEFSTLSATGGIAHPPGYPLYVLYLRAMSWLPASSVAHAAALATALLGFAAMLVLHAACRAWGARPAAASIAVALAAGSPVILGLHTSAEVFALNNLVAALVLWLSAASGPLRGARRCVALALIAGLGLANQHTAVLLAPVGLLGAVRGVREATLPAPATIALAVGALVVGLSPYLYLFVAPSTAMSWGQVSSAHDLLSAFLREDYGGFGAFAAVPGEVRVTENIAVLLSTIGRGFLWLPAILGVAALIDRTIRVRSGTGEPRWGWGMLAVSVVLAGPVLVARFNIVPEDIGLVVCQRFHVFTLVLMVIPVAIAFEHLLAWVARRSAAGTSRGRILPEVLAVAVFGAAAGVSLPSILATHSPAVEKGVVNLLRSLPEGAVLMSVSDDLYSGPHYAQQILGIRPDVVAITWGMCSLPWYRERIAARGIPITLDPTATDPQSVQVARTIFATGRPLFVELTLGNILRGFQSYPHGMVIRVLPPGAAVPTLDEIVEINTALFAAFDLAYPRPGPGAVYAAQMHFRYSKTWDVLAKALAEAGRFDDARAASAVAQDLAPRR